ncbi:MAG: DUF2188 domain-containing protein [Candidatus Moranbacteria bacterium]|nr:DUF2188 domain-containing protein [Candidatus Moranbacteria bacterium]
MKEITLKRRNLNNPQIKAYEKAVRKGLLAWHIVYDNSNWVIKRLDSKKSFRVFDTQKEAIDFGKKLARDKKTELFVHRSDGMIRERLNYGR